MRVLILGASLPGIIAASLVRRYVPDSEVSIVETSGVVGGHHLQGIHYESDDVYFDFGAHTFQQTGIPEIDACFRPESPRIATFERDLAGLYFDGSLQERQRFPDLRQHPDLESVKSEVADLLRTHEPRPLPRTDYLVEVATSRFGHTASSQLLPLISQSLSLPLEQLSGYALDLFGIQRIVTDEVVEWTGRSWSSAYRSVIAHPCPDDLPTAFRHGRRTLYGTKRGTSDLVRSILVGLDGVAIEVSARLLRLDLEMRTLDFSTQTGRAVSVPWDLMLVAIPVTALKAALESGTNGVTPPTDDVRPSKMPHAFVNVVASPLQHLSPHYWTVLGSPTSAGPVPFRVTNYQALAPSEGAARFTVEFVNASGEDGELVQAALEHLVTVGAIASRSKPAVIRVEKTSAGFFTPTVSNFEALQVQSTSMEGILPREVQLITSGRTPSEITQAEILRRVANVIGERFSSDTLT